MDVVMLASEQGVDEGSNRRALGEYKQCAEQDDHHYHRDEPPQLTPPQKLEQFTDDAGPGYYATLFRFSH